MKLFIKKSITPGIVILFLSLLIPLFLPAFAGSQEKAYQIGSNDVLSITIHAGGEKQYEGALTVSSRGMINAPFIGEIKAEGLTPSQLEKLIKEPLARDYFVNPNVAIVVKEYHSLHYYISGAVKKPGLYETSTEINLLELIAKAEGVLSERGNVAYIMRGSAHKVAAGEKVEDIASRKEPIKVDLTSLLDQGDMTANPMLKPGDVVYIPLKKSLQLSESKIYVEGEVKKPGFYDYQPGMTAMNACIIAGGFDRFAAPNRTRIIRKKGKGTEIIKLNLDRVRKGEIPDVELKPGDRIHVPETYL